MFVEAHFFSSCVYVADCSHLLQSPPDVFNVPNPPVQSVFVSDMSPSLLVPQCAHLLMMRAGLVGTGRHVCSASFFLCGQALHVHIYTLLFLNPDGFM